MDGDAFKAEYYTYMMNGLMTQLVRIELGNMVEAVSYTHLDVYKRQPYIQSIREIVQM